MLLCVLDMAKTADTTETDSIELISFEKLIVTQLLKKYPDFYGIPSLILLSRVYNGDLNYV